MTADVAAAPTDTVAAGAPADLSPRLRTGSLRVRVVLSVLTLVAVVIAALSVVVAVLLGDALRADLRQRLDDRAGYAVVLQEQGVTGQTLADQMSGGGVYSTFVSNGLAYVGRDPGPPDPAAPPAGPGAAPPTALPQPPVTPKVAYTESDNQLIAEVALADGRLTLRTSETEIDRALSALRTIQLIAGGIALLACGLMLFGIVTVALRPLNRMTALAHRIRGGVRGRRLRPTRPSTEIGRTATALDEMLDALESAEAAAQHAETRMRQFLADASHDLRTPLAGVIAGSDALIRADPQSISRGELERRLVVIVRQARLAGRLVDDLLVMTRLDAAGGSAPTAEVDLPVLVREQWDAILLRRPDLVLDLRVHGPTQPVRAVGSDLRRAVTNLLDNAAAASPAGATIGVRVSQNGSARIEVIDDGPGVPVEDRDRIFDRFVRLSAARSTVDGATGSGLGLPIARSVARAHGGDVCCLARPDGAPGGCFELRLPG